MLSRSRFCRLTPLSALFVLAACGGDEPMQPGFGSLTVEPTTPFSSSGPAGGPFSPERGSHIIRAQGGPVQWRAESTADWIDIVPQTGLALEETPASFTIVVAQGAASLDPGSYTGQVTITNIDDAGNAQTIDVSLQVGASTVLMTVTPTTGFAATGDVGGPFSPSQAVYSLGAVDGNLAWEATTDVPWVTIAPSAGSIPSGGRAGATLSINAAGEALAEGSYQGTLTFRNTRNAADPEVQYPLSLTVQEPVLMVVTPPEDFASSGDEGGPFLPSSATYQIEALGAPIDFEIIENLDWLDVNPSSGSLARNETVNIVLSVDPSATALPRGNYPGVVSFRNLTNGAGDTSRQATLTVALPPADFDQTAPADGATDVSVLPDFSWDGSLGATTYNLEVAVGGNFNNIVYSQNDIAGTSHTVTTALEPSTEHRWRVTAVNQIGTTRAQNAPFTFTTGEPPGPFDLTSPADAEAGVPISPTFTWTASVATDTYDIVVATDAALSNVVHQMTDLTGTSYTMTSTLTSNVTYYWSVDAVNTVGRTTASNAPLSFTTGAAPGVFDLAAPADNATNVAVSPALSWSASAGAASYRVEVATDNSFFAVVATEPNVPGTSVTLGTALAPDTLHFWRVIAINAVGEVVAQNAPWQFTTTPNPNAFTLTAPADTATDVALTPQFSWSASPSAASYTLEVATDAIFASIVATEAGVAGTSVTLGTTLANDTTYYWRVTESPGNTVATNAPFSFTTVAANAPGPFTLTAPADGTTQAPSPITLQWTDSTGETGYTAEVATDAAFTSIVATGNVGADVTSWTVTTGVITPGQLHYWRVTANSAQGNTTATNAPFSFTVDYFQSNYAPGIVVREAALAPRVGGGWLVGGYVNAAAPDLWAVSLDSNGSIAWQTSVSGVGDDIANSVDAIAGGGALIAGYTTSAGAGLDDAWLVEFDNTGAVTTQTVIGGLSTDSAAAGRRTADNGTVLAGTSASYGAGATDGWIVKLDNTGALGWSNAYGGAQSDELLDIQQTTDTGYIAAGHSSSFGATQDAWVLKLDAAGVVTWASRYGGAASDQATSVIQTNDGGYAVAGVTQSFGANANGEAWVFKLDSGGVMQWQNRIDAGAVSFARLTEAVDNGLLISIDEGATGTGATVVKLSEAGATVWQRRYGADARARGASETAGTVAISTIDATANPARLEVWNLRADGAPLGASVTLPTTATATTAVATTPTVTGVTPLISASALTPATTNATVNQVAP